jgi:hypothetical protein
MYIHLFIYLPYPYLDLPAQWNTYGDLPNSELLRGFGHVDYLPLPTGGHGNPGDVAELRADLLVQCLGASDDMEERIDWWLEEGGEECVHRPHFACILLTLSVSY